MALIAIEFEEHQLLVAVSQKAGGRQRISHTFAMNIQGLTEPVIGQRLEKELLDCHATKADAVAIVSRSLAEVREVTVPPAPDEELPEMIRFQARAEFAVFNDQWKLDFVPLTDDPQLPRKVLAAAIGPQLEARIQSICKDAGVKLKRIVLRPFATLDLLKPHLESGQQILIVDPHGQWADMSIVTDGKLASTRTVRLPQSLTQDQRSQQLITEVRRTLASHKASSNGGMVTQVVVPGEASHYRHLKGNLESKLGLQTTFLSPFDLIDRDAPSPGDPDIEPSRFASLLGALKTQREGQSPQLDFVNFRKTEIKKTDYSKIYFYAALAASVALMGLFFAWWVLRTQAQDIQTARANLVNAIKVNEGNDRFASVQQRLNEVRLIDQWKMEDVNWLTELSLFSQRYLLPDDVIADSFTASVQRDGIPKIVLKGRIVEDLSKTDQLISALSERPYEVEPIDTGTVAADQQNDYPSTFEYHLRIPESAKTDLNVLNRRAAAVTSTSQKSDPSLAKNEIAKNEFAENEFAKNEFVGNAAVAGADDDTRRRNTNAPDATAAMGGRQ